MWQDESKDMEESQKRKCKWVCGRGDEKRRWGGTAVFCSNQNDLLKVGARRRRHMETFHLKYLPSLGNVYEYNSSLLFPQWNATIHNHSLANFQFWKGFTGTFTAVPLPSTSGLEKRDSPRGRKDYQHIKRNCVYSTQPNSGLTFLWGYSTFLPVSLLFFPSLRAWTLSLLHQRVIYQLPRNKEHLL